MLNRSHSRISGETSDESETGTSGSAAASDARAPGVHARVDEGMQEADGDAPHPSARRKATWASTACLVQRQQHARPRCRAVRARAGASGAAPAAAAGRCSGRTGRSGSHCPGRGRRGSLRSSAARSCTLALDDRIGRQRGAVDQDADIGGRHAGLGQHARTPSSTPSSGSAGVVSTFVVPGARHARSRGR